MFANYCNFVKTVLVWETNDSIFDLSMIIGSHCFSYEMNHFTVKFSATNLSLNKKFCKFIRRKGEIGAFKYVDVQDRALTLKRQG